MTISARSVLMAGVATVTASAVLIAPSVQPPPPPAPAPVAATVELAAQSRNFVDTPAFAALVAAAQQIAPSAFVEIPRPGDPPPAPTATLLAFPGLGQAIRNVYNIVIPIVDYGVAWAQYLVGWIPWGWLISDQIGIFYYDLIRPIVTSITYNISFWIDGSISFGQGLNNVILDSANAGIGFLNGEIRWGWGFLPPLPFPPPQIPYLPWFGLLQAQAAEVTAEGFTAPVTPGGATAPQGPRGFLKRAVGELTKILTPEKTVEETVEGTTPVDELDPGNKNVTRSLIATPHGVAKGIVQAQGEVRGAIRDAATAVADSKKPGAVREALTAAPRDGCTERPRQR